MTKNFVLRLTNEILNRLNELDNVYEFHVTTYLHKIDVSQAEENLEINDKMRILTEKYQSDLLEILK